MNSNQTLVDRLKHCIGVDTIGLRVEGVYPQLPTDGARNLRAENPTSNHQYGYLFRADGRRSHRLKASINKGWLDVEGSVANHYQCQNIVASSDMTMLCYAMLDSVRKEFPLNLEDQSRRVLFAQGRDIEVQRVDVFAMLDVPNNVSRQHLINELGIATLRSGGNVSVYFNETVYLDQHSQLKSLKMYLKDHEIANAKKDIAAKSDLASGPVFDLTKKTVRIELVMRKKFLRRHFKGKVQPYMLTQEVLATLLADALADLNLSDVALYLQPRHISHVPRRLQGAILAWAQGWNMTDFFGNNRSLFSRYCQEIKQYCGISIEGMPPSRQSSKLPLERIFSPENFVIIPNEIKGNSEWYFSLDMQNVITETRASLSTHV